MRALKQHFIEGVEKIENTTIHGLYDETSAPHIISVGIAGSEVKCYYMRWKIKESMYHPDRHVRPTIRRSAVC